MLRSSLQYTSRPPASARGNKPTSIALMEPNLYSAYAEYKKEKAKRGTQKAKGKENKKRKSMQVQDFPNFAVKFKNAMKQSQFGTIESSQQSSRADIALYQSFGRQVESKTDRTPIIKGIMSARDCQSKELKSSTKQFHHHKQTPSSNKFFEAVTKIFKGLDIFNRGRISETNINKWIPESALYFLGKVFQKIRMQRLALNCQQFLNLCRPLLDESSEQDIKWFIDEVNGKEEVIHVSIDATESQRSILISPVHKPEEKVPSTKRKAEDRSAEFKLEFTNIAERIKERQNILKFREQKQKEKEFGIATFSGECYSFFASKDIVVSHQKPKQTPSDKKSQISAFKKVESPKVRVFNSSIKKEPAKLINPPIQTKKKSVPKFTFQLPSPIQEPPICKSTNRSPKNQPEARANRFQSEYQLDQPFQSTQRAMTSRIIRQNITSTDSKQSLESAQLKSEMKNSTAKFETERIDKLSSKLEEYIKFNKEKIEKNKQFIRQNSVVRT